MATSKEYANKIYEEVNRQKFCPYHHETSFFSGRACCKVKVGTKQHLHCREDGGGEGEGENVLCYYNMKVEHLCFVLSCPRSPRSGFISARCFCCRHQKLYCAIPPPPPPPQKQTCFYGWMQGATSSPPQKCWKNSQLVLLLLLLPQPQCFMSPESRAVLS